jgi:hypothetical protein
LSYDSQWVYLPRHKPKHYYILFIYLVGGSILNFGWSSKLHACGNYILPSTDTAEAPNSAWASCRVPLPFQLSSAALQISPLSLNPLPQTTSLLATATATTFATVGSFPPCFGVLRWHELGKGPLSLLDLISSRSPRWMLPLLCSSSPSQLLQSLPPPLMELWSRYA